MTEETLNRGNEIVCRIRSATAQLDRLKSAEVQMKKDSVPLQAFGYTFCKQAVSAALRAEKKELTLQLTVARAELENL